MHSIVAKPLTADAFAPFGSVIQQAGAPHFPINAGSTERYHRLAVTQACQAEGEDNSAQTIISLFAGQPFDLPVTIELMERHPLGTQAFMPIDGHDWLIVVAATDSEPQPDDLYAFFATGEQGVNYARGVWHHPLLALSTVSRFVVVDREGAGNNLHECRLSEAVLVQGE
jgi:ureidoglycolate lyase